jgi:hypothetical protein
MSVVRDEVALEDVHISRSESGFSCACGIFLHDALGL